MNPHPVHALDPVFEFLDGLIRDHGDTLFMLVCYAAIPLCAWILFGGIAPEIFTGAIVRAADHCDSPACRTHAIGEEFRSISSATGTGLAR
jgi:hypothetical protein